MSENKSLNCVSSWLSGGFLVFRTHLPAPVLLSPGGDASLFFLRTWGRQRITTTTTTQRRKFLIDIVAKTHLLTMWNGHQMLAKPTTCSFLCVRLNLQNTSSIPRVFLTWSLVDFRGLLEAFLSMALWFLVLPSLDASKCYLKLLD